MIRKWLCFGARCKVCGELPLILLKRAFPNDRPCEPDYCPVCGTKQAFKEVGFTPVDPDKEGEVKCI